MARLALSRKKAATSGGLVFKLLRFIVLLFDVKNAKETMITIFMS